MEIAEIVERLVTLNTDHHLRMRADHNQRAASGNASVNSADQRSRDRIVLAMRGAAERFGVKRESSKLLELGAGYAGDRGYLISELGCSYTGVEVVPHVAAASEGLGVLNMAIEQAPESWNGQFDWVYSRHVMEHVPDVAVAISTIARVLSPHGVVGVVTPHYFPDPEPAHVTQLRLHEWCDAYRKHGLVAVYAVQEHHACDEAHLVLMRREFLEHLASSCSDTIEDAVCAAIESVLRG